jgi:regulator of telomere elongation helicase 1
MQTIDGCDIYFPFKPYPCQTNYFEKVISALQNSQNALLESPTGTGKTLSLLCSTLAWLRKARSTM